MSHYEGILAPSGARWAIDGAGIDPPNDVVSRIWRKDASLWHPGDEDPAERLGWLELPTSMRTELAAIEAFVRDVAADMDAVVLLGMGGSSLAPEVFSLTFGSGEGYPRLAVLDSTHPEEIRQVEAGLDLQRTLWLVSSKSGTTIETMSLFKYFRSKYDTGAQFAAITDPGTSLHALAEDDGFSRVFLNPPDIGGRYSALSLFGLVPAALIGVDLDALLGGAATIADQCRSDKIEDNPALALGWALGELALRGRDKLTFLISPGLAGLGAWIEQLMAESTGKVGKGIVPVVDEARGTPEGYGDDRVFVAVQLQDERPERALLDELSARGHPVMSLSVSGANDVAAHMYMWEFATAVAGVALGVNPFDQPNVEAAKRESRDVLSPEADIAWPDEDPAGLFADMTTGELAAFLAFAPRSTEAAEALSAARRKVMDGGRVATSAGYGPRYLHSTGQLYKGGPDKLRAVVVLDEPGDDVAVPGEGYGFARLTTAQALGDYRALEQAGRKVSTTSWSRFERWANGV